MRRILIVGGAPRLPVDAIRHLTVHATGTTACALRDRLGPAAPVDLLLGRDAVTAEGAARFTTREELDTAIRAWLRAHGDGVVVLSAAINDYQVETVEHVLGGQRTVVAPGSKAPSRADELIIRLAPAEKLIDRLAAWGHRGPLVACKYQDSEGVIAAAQALRARVGADLVVANSIDGSVQALVDAGVEHHPDRPSLLTALTDRLRRLAG